MVRICCVCVVRQYISASALQYLIIRTIQLFYISMVRRHCLNLSTDSWLTNYCVYLFHSLMALGNNENL